MASQKQVFIIDGSRSPFVKARGAPGPFSAADLAVASGQPLLLRQPFAADAVDEVILGCVAPAPNESNIARVVALRLGCGISTPAWTVQRNCASGMQAVDSACGDILRGRADLVLAGGTEAMSRSPLLLSEAMVAWLAAWRKAPGLPGRARQLARLRPAYLIPVIALLRGLNDPLVGLSMGQTAENLAHRFALSREDMDAYALESHRRLAEAIDQGRLEERVPLYDAKGHCYEEDDGLRRSADPAKMSRLPPVFDRAYGLVTAANSAQISDGAAWLLLASEAAVDRYGLQPLARILDTEWSGLAPAEMGLGPAYAMSALLARQHKQVADIDYWEINEAFAAQVLACLEAWEDDDFCQMELGLDQAWGSPDLDCVNVDGGAISLGHPVGASGARILLHLTHVLHRERAKLGIASLCIGGGQGGAVLLEAISQNKS